MLSRRSRRIFRLAVQANAQQDFRSAGELTTIIDLPSYSNTDFGQLEVFNQNGEDLHDELIELTELPQIVGENFQIESGCDGSEIVLRHCEHSEASDIDEIDDPKEDPDYEADNNQELESDEQFDASGDVVETLRPEASVFCDDSPGFSVAEVNGLSPKRGRKRVRHPEQWKSNVRKKKREAGEEYTTKKGKLVIEKSIKRVCLSSCRRKCSENISSEERQIIFNNFWRKGSTNDLKRQFVAGNVLSCPVNRRVASQTEFRRNATLKYFFDLQGEKRQVCKTFFLNALAISESFVKVAMKKKAEGGVVEVDMRGKHKPPNKLNDMVIEGIRSHIKMFPVLESHYSRERSARLYLGSDLNISKMYAMYREYSKENDVEEEFVAKKWLYSHIFNTEFNLGFKPPAKDTCDDCDAFNIILKDEDANHPEKTSETKKDYEQHLDEARKRYALKSDDKAKSKLPGSKTKVIMLDLQKCLPTPYLTNSSAFYLRKLWTFNLTILDSTQGTASCAMWDESIAARGAEEISSCLLKWALDNLQSTDIEELTIWTDNCGGQNRNFPMMSSYFRLLKSIPNLKVINHKFLLKGHTHMEVDGVHSVVERAKAKLGGTIIAIPWDWQQFVRSCKFKDVISVLDMAATDFKNFKSLHSGPSSPLVKRKQNSSGEKFLISEVVQMQVRANDIGVLYYKTSFDGKFLSFDCKRKTRSAAWPLTLPEVSNEKSIAPEKYNDLQKLLKWVPRCFHDFFKSLRQNINGAPQDEHDDDGDIV